MYAFLSIFRQEMNTKYVKYVKYTSFQKHPSNIKATVSIFLSKLGQSWVRFNVLGIFDTIMREYDILNKM